MHTTAAQTRSCWVLGHALPRHKLPVTAACAPIHVTPLKHPHPPPAAAGTRPCPSGAQLRWPGRRLCCCQPLLPLLLPPPCALHVAAQRDTQQSRQ
jgi:hypothetical protein